MENFLGIVAYFIMYNISNLDEVPCDKDHQFSCEDDVEIPTIKKPKCKVFGCTSYLCKTYSTKNPTKCVKYECMEFFCRQYEDIPLPYFLQEDIPEPGRFKRSINGIDSEVKCIAKPKMCDGKIDCPNGRDEAREVCGRF